MITLFTGAGASKPLKFPVTSEFFTEKAGKNLQGTLVYKHVRRFLGKDTVDVEDALRLLYPYIAFLGTPTGKLIESHISSQWMSEIPNFVTNTNNLCFEYYARTPGAEQVKSCYWSLLELCDWNHEKINLFTTNYDPVTDVLMELAHRSDVPSYDGFDRFGNWDSPGYATVRSNGLAVYRLHGSMSWIERDGKIRNTRDYARRVPGRTEHLLIYPGFKGDLELEGHPALAFAHNALRSELAQSTALLTIGFSFRDPHLNDIIRDALRMNDKLRLVVLNPVWPSGPDMGLDDLRQEFSDRVSHVATAFGSIDEQSWSDLRSLLLHRVSMQRGSESLNPA